MKMLETARDLGEIEQRSVLLELANHVMDMKLQVATVHERQYETERVLGLVSVGEIDYETRVDFLQYLLLVERHHFAFTFFDSFLFELLTSVHATRAPRLTGAHLAEPAFAQNSVHSERVLGDG